MQRKDFYYELPPEQIAQAPLAERSAGRLLQVNGGNGTWTDSQVRDLPQILRPGDLLVLNDTRVLPARLQARKPSGGAVELLLDRIVSDTEAWFLARASKPLRPGGSLLLGDGLEIHIHEKVDMRVRLGIPAGRSWLALLEAQGSTPLPPYIHRTPSADDAERYQTVYAAKPGAVAAPTAGLHFDAALLAVLAERGVDTAFVTLHVGAGTFLPMRSERVEDHEMHAESMEVPAVTVAAIAAARARGGRVIAVGTTACRALESAGASGTLRPFAGETRLFLYPGQRFHVVDLLLTNFHLPESTLLMLVSAFAGQELMLASYRHAVAAGYRFFSYGDAMLIYPCTAAR
ncbi:MAG: tRNA preQ1(34) S-adenosylmethionine ribosyltransferase-isomerase QueA [Acidithiobacillus sp.]